MLNTLAIARHLQNQTGTSIRKIIRTLSRIHTVIVEIDGHELIARTPVDDNTQAILHAIGA